VLIFRVLVTGEEKEIESIRLQLYKENWSVHRITDANIDPLTKVSNPVHVMIARKGDHTHVIRAEGNTLLAAYRELAKQAGLSS
jgi:hypothetical protein